MPAVIQAEAQQTDHPGAHRFPRRLLRAFPWSWQLVALSSVVFFVVGLVFASAWRPTAGPYRDGEAYPFGTELQAWYVTVGFDWVAFGILFAAAALAARQVRNGWYRAALGVSFGLIWLPHIIIGAAFAVDRWFFSG